MGWRRILLAVGVALLASAAVALTWQVSVRAGGERRGCGSAFDVVADRTGWEEWRRQDITEATPGAVALLRTSSCPDAVNRRVVLAGVLAAAGGVAVVAGSARRRPKGTARTARVHRLATAVTVTGIVLTVGGLAALTVLVSNARSTLFLYVDRPVVVLIGLVALVPAVALVVGGRALELIAELYDERPEDGDAT